jgi:hypothetical protein
MQRGKASAPPMLRQTGASSSNAQQLCDQTDKSGEINEGLVNSHVDLLLEIQAAI